MNRREALAALTALPATARISVAEARPGDVIVCELDEHVDSEGAARIKRQLEAVWPGCKVAVLSKGIRVRIAPG